MSGARTTKILAVLLVVAGAGCAWAFARLDRAAGDAEEAARAYATSQAQLKQLSGRAITGGGGGAVAGATGAADANAQVNRRLHDAAAAAGAAEKLVSIEPGEPNQVAGTDFQETLVFLRLEPLPLRQLVTFLHAHAAADAAARTKAIELSTAGDRGADNLWVADVTLAYTRYAPQSSSSSMSASEATSR